MMKLLYSVASPYARCVRTLTRILAIEGIDEHIVDPFANEAQLLEVNPLGKIPCLLTRDGMPLFDSEVIMRFLDSEYGQQQIFGQYGGDWPLQCQYALIKGLLDSSVSLRQEQLREQEGVRSAFWTARYEQALLRGLLQVEHQNVIAASQLQAPQIALVCLLEYLDFRHPDLAWRNVAPACALWFSDIRHLPAFSATRPR